LKYSDFKQLKNIIEQASSILITTHTNPDGDAIGSSLGMCHFLKALGKQDVKVMVPNDYPAFLKWLEGTKEVINFEHHPEIAKKAIESADLIFCLDYNDISRTDKPAEHLLNSKATKVLIDHHPYPKDQFDFAFSSTETSSTAELVFDFIGQTHGHQFLNRNIAEGLYVGIMTDTGSFSYMCNYAKTYNAVAMLVGQGIVPQKLHSLVYDTYSEGRLRLLGFCLSERLRVFKDYHTAYIYLSEKDLKRFNYRAGDIEGIVNYPLSIKDIKFAVLFREKNGTVRMSLRSKGSFAVNKIASEHFKGGGHKNAAGADSDLSLEQTLKKFEKLLELYKEELKISEV
jgi:bifunctional oligoribonuclease and PAP phosphatase NrnA